MYRQNSMIGGYMKCKTIEGKISREVYISRLLDAPPIATHTEREYIYIYARHTIYNSSMYTYLFCEKYLSLHSIAR